MLQVCLQVCYFNFILQFLSVMFLRFEFHGFEGAMSITSENVDESEEKVSIRKNQKRINESAEVTVDDGDLADMNKNKKKRY